MKVGPFYGGNTLIHLAICVSVHFTCSIGIGDLR